MVAFIRQPDGEAGLCQLERNSTPDPPASADDQCRLVCLILHEYSGLVSLDFDHQKPRKKSA
jgi:hypothetical protein